MPIGHQIPALVVDDHTYLARPTLGQLREIIPDPMSTENPTLRQLDPMIAASWRLREDQRLFVGQKKRNLNAYREHLYGAQQPSGGVPPIMAYVDCAVSFEPATADSHVGHAIVPYRAAAFALDGETQLQARLQAAKQNEAIWDHIIPIVLIHSRSRDWRMQTISDIQSKGTRASRSFTAARDRASATAQVATYLQDKLGSRLRIDRDRRYARPGTLMTSAALALYINAFLIGTSAFNRKDPVTRLSSADLLQSRERLAQWTQSILNLFEQQLYDRRHYVIGYQAVLGSLGAAAHSPEAESYERWNYRTTKLLHRLRYVDFRKGDHWLGILCEPGTNSGYTVLGIRAAGHRVHNALTNEDHADYHHLRPTMPANVAL